VARRCGAGSLAHSVAAIVGLRARDLNALVRGHVAQVHLTLVGAAGLALNEGVTLASGSKLAGECGLVANVTLNTLVCAVDTVADKGVRRVGVETGALSTGDVARVHNVLTAPPAEILRNTFLAREVRTAVISRNSSCSKHCEGKQKLHHYRFQ